MKKSKGIIFGALLVVMLILSMTFVPAVSADVLNEDMVPEIVTTEQPELIPEPLPTVDPASK